MEIYSQKEKINLADDEMARKMGKVVEIFFDTYKFHKFCFRIERQAKFDDIFLRWVKDKVSMNCNSSYHLFSMAVNFTLLGTLVVDGWQKRWQKVHFRESNWSQLSNWKITLLKTEKLLQTLAVNLKLNFFASF